MAEQSPEQIAAELQEGERRRAFVVDELIDAGMRDGELLQWVLRLTGVDEPTARRLIAVRERPADAASADVPKRDERLADNEIAFRRLNEELATVGRHEDAPERIDLVCECADRDCSRRLMMPFAEYEWLRQHPRRFVVLPGHEAPAVEDVVERFAGYVIVEKHRATHAQVEAADPRA